MKTSSYFKGKVKENFEKFFDKSLINRLGKVSGFIKRQTNKVTAFAFVAGFIETCFTGRNTYSAWAANIGLISGQTISKQAICERMSEPSTSYAQELFSHVMKTRINVEKESRLCKLFKQVILQDSSALSLPDCLVKEFPGNVSRGKQKAVARLQCIINITKMKWLHLSLDPYTKNDQSAIGTALPYLKKGDLLIRDLGYFSLKAIPEIEKRKAFFINRLRYGITLYNEKGKEITWKDLSRKKGVVDCNVLIGKKDKIGVRIVMIPLPKAIVNERIRKAKQDRDKRLNHSEDYYKWIAYNIFITNVEEATLSGKEIAEVYRIRWQIEIVFKSWKSGGRMQQILHEGCTNIERVKTTVYLLLMFFCLVMQKVYLRYCNKVAEQYHKHLSLIKLLAYVADNFSKIICSSSAKLIEQLAKYCCFDKRNDRTNMTEFIMNL
jgi:hypothetical protein